MCMYLSHVHAHACRDESGPHTWVITRGDAGSVTCWESLTGKRYELPAHGGGGGGAAAAGAGDAYHPYRAISSAFNHESFYANCQQNDSLPGTSLDLTDRSAWRAMDATLLRALTPLPQAPHHYGAPTVLQPHAPQAATPLIQAATSRVQAAAPCSQPAPPPPRPGTTAGGERAGPCAARGDARG